MDRKETAGPSTTARFGRDAKHVKINKVTASRDDKGEGGDLYWELSDRMDREQRQVPPLRLAPVGMTKWGFALPCNVVADGWVEPPQKTDLDKSDFRPSLRDSLWTRRFSHSALKRVIRVCYFTER